MDRKVIDFDSIGIATLGGFGGGSVWGYTQNVIAMGTNSANASIPATAQAEMVFNQTLKTGIKFAIIGGTTVLSAEVLASVRGKRDPFNFGVGGVISGLCVSLYLEDMSLKNVGKRVIGYSLLAAAYSHINQQSRDFQQYREVNGHDKPMFEKLTQLFVTPFSKIFK